MQPSVETVYDWLAEVPDPEIPVVSVVDLGIVRDVEWLDDVLTVTVTPTYSGCPATSVISLDIANALTAKGVEKVDVRRRLSPAWTTAWISEAAGEKLRAFGIAPPVAGSAACVGALKPTEMSCPHCGSTDTEMLSGFGSTPCKALYRCRACREPFDYFKAI